MTTLHGKNKKGTTSRLFGYARVSSKDQNERRQIDALLLSGVPLTRIFTDKQSGKDFKRPAYRQLLRKMKAEDVLFISSIDRLGRNYEEIQDQWRFLTKVKGVEISVLDMPLLDTRQNKDLIGDFISDLVLQILSFVAHAERVNIRARQAQGIKAAKARGVRFGRPPKPIPKSFYKAAHRYAMRKISMSEAARQCSMPLSTFRSKFQKVFRTKAS